MNEQLHDGTIEMWHPTRHFGFIAVSGRRDGIFFHGSALSPRSAQPTRGQAVRFVLGKDRDGQRDAAVRVYPQ